jgi:hypothetical protein
VGNFFQGNPVVNIIVAIGFHVRSYALSPEIRTTG